MSRKCACGADLIDNEAVREALAIWDEVDHYGNLHVYVEDGNLDDHWFEPEDGMPSSARDSVYTNASEATPEQVIVEMALVQMLEEMTEDERFACYGRCRGCRYVHDNDLGWKDEDPS